MGKKRSVSVRRIAEMLIARSSESYTLDFEENKNLISEMMEFPSKIVRNQVAGYITRFAHNTASGKVQLEGEEGNGGESSGGS